MKQCPNCSTMNYDEAERCLDCHVPFADSKAAFETSRTSVSQSGSWLTPAGWILIVLGLLMLLYGLFSSGAPQYSDTLNIGLLNDKTNMVIAGGFAFTSGSMFVSVGSILARLANTTDAVRTNTQRDIIDAAF